MRLYVLETINGATGCIGITAENRDNLMKIMNFIESSTNKFETIPDLMYEDYSKNIFERLGIPYEPYIQKYKIIFECDINHLQEGEVFRVEE
jgi:hypothetical protein